MAYTSPEVEERVMEDIVDRLRVLNFMGPWKEAADEIERLRKAMDVQSNAVNVLHQAETSELNHLRKTAQEAYMAKMTLDSEREANRILTDEIERLRLANSDLQMHYDYAKTEYDRLREELQNEYYRGFNEGDEAGYKRGYSDGSWTT